MSAAPSDFFYTVRTAPEIKSELLPRVFEVWSTAMLQQTKSADLPLCYIDLQPVLDSNQPMPAVLQLLRQVYKSTGSRTDLNRGTKTTFYDAELPALAELREKLEQLPFYQDLVHPPAILPEVDNEVLPEQILEVTQPTLAFLNPIVEGMSQQVLLRAAEAAGPDVMMLFDPKLLDSGVKKAKSDSVWHQLLGEKLEKIKAFYKQNRNADRREEYLFNSFEEIFRNKGAFTLRFRINLPDKKQTNFYMLLVVKSAQAYIGIKELLTRYSDYQEDGVPLFGANLQHQQMSLFQEHYKYSIAGLVQDLSRRATDYNNRTVQQVHEMHSIGTHYILENYKEAYEQLLRQGKVRFINPKTGQVISKPTYTSKIRYSA
ncbi:hypothetical protein [Pontibacter sp. FD36]|uniref:hypothetical protein n=1 Tax=Pontibacter sp. FD36 TaxID=2789860 RepID=UPI001E363EF0|nr:hypothetical protein [Pontibacter sp. FD36]